MARRCSNCRTQLVSPARFCPKCGRRTGGPGAVFTVLGVLFVAALVTAGFFLFVASPSTAARRERALTEFTRSAEALNARAAKPMTPADLELTENPGRLQDLSIPAGTLRLNGVSLGDAADRIPAELFTSRSGNEINTDDGNAVRLQAGQVQQIVLRNRDLLARLPINRAADITTYFGSGATVSSDNAGTTYTYAGRGLVIRWNQSARAIDQVVLSSKP